MRRLPPGALMSIAGLTVSSLATSNAFIYDGHGFETNDEVTVRALEGGELSAPLVAGTTYFARRVSNESFELAAAADGAAINLTTDSTTTVVARAPDFDLWIEFYSRWVEVFLPAHAVPLGEDNPVHPLVRGIVADLVAERMFNISGQPSTEAMDKILASSETMLKTLGAGIPLRGAPVTAPTNLAVVSASRASSGRGYGCGWGIR